MSDSERVIVRVLRQNRPGWRRPDIILWRLGPATWVGYSVGDVADKLVVRMWGDQDQVRSVLCSHCFRWYTKHLPSCLQALRQNSQAQQYSDQGLGPRLLGTFSHGHVTPYLAPCADLSLLHQPAIYPLVAARVGSLHRWGQ